jgi:hypothetical protein
MSEIDTTLMRRLRSAAFKTHRAHIDRAAAVATAVLQIVNAVPGHAVRQQIENYLRDKIADLENQIIAERGRSDV